MTDLGRSVDPAKLTPVLVRVAPELLEHLETEGSGPVVIVGIDRQDDGTYDMVLRSEELERLLNLLAQGEHRIVHGGVNVPGYTGGHSVFFPGDVWPEIALLTKAWNDGRRGHDA